MTVAISGAGKTYWATHIAKPEDIILDSDAIREEIYGDATIQDDPARIFNIMGQRTWAALKANKNVFYVATNLNMRRRINFLNSLKKHFPDIKYVCVYINCPIEIARERNSIRSRNVPMWVIDKQIRQMQVPWYSEGWDEILIVNNYPEWPKQREEITLRVAKFGSQQNSHHELDLYEHCRKANQIAKINNYNPDIIAAALYHDFGKAYTAIYWNKDNYKELHFPNHENVGAVLCLNMGFSLKVAALVNYHMVLYMDSTAQKAWRIRLGEELWQDLKLLHICDKQSH